MRKIPPALVAYIDQKLAGNALAAIAIKNKDPRTLFGEVLKTFVGIKEKTGKNDGYLVELIQSVVGMKKGAAWCMCLMQAGIAYCELKTNIKSPIPSGAHCLTVWNKTPALFKVKNHPAPNAIAIWGHNYGKGPEGHTEGVLGADKEWMRCIGGNTSGADAAGKVTSEGNGCYYTKRSMQNFPKIKTAGKMVLKGFIIPFKAA